MASIEYRRRSTRVVVYVDKQKLCFSLGKIPKKVAERFAKTDWVGGMECEDLDTLSVGARL